MVKLKFNDIKSMSAVADALRKNGYQYSTFVIWDKGAENIEFYVVEISVTEEDKKKYNKSTEVDFDFEAEDL